MKRFLNKKNITILTVVTLFISAMPIITHAQEVSALSLLDILNPLTYINKLMEFVVVTIAGKVLALVGVILDTAIRFSLDTGYIYGSLTVINETWAIIRDICNLFFIFALIWISISIILSLSSFNAKRHLTQLIIAALIINFSLYFTKVFIDVSNIFGQWLYNGIFNVLAVNQASSLSALIAMKFEIFRLWENPTKIIWDNQSSLLSSLMRLLVVLVATYVFMYTAILFLTRAVTIIFLLILSPIGFVGGLLPKLEEYSKKWWSELVDAMTFPVVYLLMLYISFQLINSMDGTNLWSTSNLFKGADGSGFVAGIDIGKTFKFIVVICALLITLKVAKESAGQLGKAASGIAGGLGSLSTRFGASGLSASAFVGRRFVGQYAAKKTEDKDLNERAAGKVGNSALGRAYNQVMGKATLAVYRKGAESSFDVRGLAATTAIANATGIDVGKAGGKGGYAQMVKDQEKSDKEYAAKFGDSKEGIDRQMAYAESRKNSLYNRLIIGKKATEKNAGNLRTEVGKLETKAQTQEVQKEAQKIATSIVEAKIAQNVLKGASTAKTNEDVDNVIQDADVKLNMFLAGREADARSHKIKIIAQGIELSNRISKLLSEGKRAEAAALASDVNNIAAANFVKEASEEELAEAKKIGLLTQKDFEAALTNYREIYQDTEQRVKEVNQVFSRARSERDILRKKELSAQAAADIESKIIGKEGDWDNDKKEFKKTKFKPGATLPKGFTRANADGNADVNGEFAVDSEGEFHRKEGEGLLKQLQKKRREAQKKHDNARDIGADSGGSKGGGGDKDGGSEKK